MILVSILGDFHSSIVPIFFEFKHRIKKHIFIHDDSDYDTRQLDKVIKGQKEFLKHYEKSDIAIINYEVITIDEDSYDDIVKCYKYIISSTNRMEDIYLNATDGLNSISIILSSKLLKKGANVIAYDRYANTYNLHTNISMTKHIIKQNIDIKNHLRLKGYKLLSKTEEETLANRKDLILELMQDPLKYKNYADYLSTKKNKPKDFYKYEKILIKMGKLNDVSFIQGTVFEEYIYHLVNDYFDFDDVMTGVSVEFEKNLKNEFDILMIKDNHLHTIECKFVNFLNGEHYVYKTNSIIDYLDDDGKAMILSIGGENEKYLKSGKKKFQFSKGDLCRAKYKDIYIYQNSKFEKELFLDTVAMWFEIKKVRTT